MLSQPDEEREIFGGVDVEEGCVVVDLDFDAMPARVVAQRAQRVAVGQRCDFRARTGAESDRMTGDTVAHRICDLRLAARRHDPLDKRGYTL